MRFVYKYWIKRIEELSGGRGFAFLTTAQKESLDQPVEEPTKTGQEAFVESKTEAPTVITGATISEDVVPDNDAKLKDLSETGKFVDDGGVERFADGQAIEIKDEDDTFTENLANFNRKFGRQPSDSTGISKTDGGGLDTTGAFDEEGNVIGGTKTPTSQDEQADSISQEQQSIINELKSSLDEATKRQIDVIEQQFNLRRKQRAEIDRRAQEGIQQSLLIGGSSRFAPISSGGIIEAKETASLLAIAELDAQEKTLINAALEAQRKGDFEILDKQLTLIETKRKEKQKATEELIKAIAEENKKIKEQVVKSTRDTAVSSLLTQGMTDPNKILNFLNFDEEGNQIGDFTAEEIADTLKNLEPEVKNNLSGDAKELQSFIDIGLIDQNLTPEEQWDKFVDISAKKNGSKILSVTEAGKLGVPFGTTEADAFGLMPKTDPSGLPSKTISQIDKISASFDSAPITKNFNEVQNKFISVANIIDAGVGGPGDLALVFEFMKALDPTSVVRESEYEAAAKSGNIFAGAWTKFNKGYFDPKGGILPEEVKNSFQELVGIKYDASLNGYNNLRKEKGRLINMKTGEDDGMEYLINYELTSTKNLRNKNKESYVVDTPNGVVDLSVYEK